jgi:leucyl/phenylalanyl-tRNA---protein transferase
MSIFILDNKLWFPPAGDTTAEGLLAMGGDLSEERLLLAYRNGIFPWFANEFPLWWCPDPRFVLFPGELKISKSMQRVLHKNEFEFKMNTAFEKVIHHCKTVKREDQQGTWITNDVERAYINLHKKGFAHSAEAWQHDKLVGGLYGVLLVKIFFGESMFSFAANASKFAFISYIEHLKKDEEKLIDCQVYTKHLESLGAEMIARKEFLQLLKTYV